MMTATHPAGAEPERTPLGDEREHPAPCRTCRRMTWNITDCPSCVRRRARAAGTAGGNRPEPPAATAREGWEP